MSKTKKILSVLAASTILFAMAVFLSDPAEYARAVSEGISLWGAVVLPAIFPFLFLTALFTGLPPFRALSRKLSPAMGKLFRVSGEGGGAALLAALSGYPVGARLISDLFESGRIRKEETFRLSCLCTTSGPPFLVGTVGCMMFQDVTCGWILLVSHLFAVWLVCFFMRFFGKKGYISPASPLHREENVLSDSLYRAVISVLCVGGYIALFSCFGEMLERLGVFSPFGGNVYLEGALRGLLEMTTGCAFLSAYKTPLSLALSCALVTFGGLCVLCQQASYLSHAGVRLLPFLGVKALQAAVAFLLCLALASLLCF